MSVFAQSKAHRRAIFRITAVSLGALLFSGGNVLVTSGPALANGCPAPVAPSGNPYIIDTAEKLAWISGSDFARDPNNLDRVTSADDSNLQNRLGATYRQTADIDMSDFQATCWVSIGSLRNSSGDMVNFAGLYDGGNFVLSSFVTVGLPVFGFIQGVDSNNPAEVKNLSIRNATITEARNQGILGVQAKSDSFVDNVHVSGSMVLAGNEVGGLFDEMSGNAVLSGSSSQIEISSSATDRKSVG